MSRDWENTSESESEPASDVESDDTSAPRQEHVPVLLDEVLHWLDPQPGQVVVDCTVGRAGHTQAILEKLGNTGRVIALDQDLAGLQDAQARVPDPRIHWHHARFTRLGQVLKKLEIDAVDGVLADLGVSSPQLDNAERGFSFRHDGPLDMRMDQTQGESAHQLVNRASESQLSWIFKTYGEERFSHRIAQAIVKQREQGPINTTGQLAELVRSAIPAKALYGKGGKGGGRKPGTGSIDPATRVFQGLRIAVNDELNALSDLLALLPGVVKPGGNVVILSFHSLEDRLIKQAFRQDHRWQERHRKPVMAHDDERQRNPRSRSAKLRSAQRIEPTDQDHRH